MNVRRFIQLLADKGELAQIESAVDARLELSCLTDRQSKHNGSALLFRRVYATNLQFATNLFGSAHRMALALGAESLAGFGERTRRALESCFFTSTALTLNRLISAPGVESVEAHGERLEADLDLLPQIRFWPEEERSFLTLAVVVSCDPETLKPNYGLYRVGVAGQSRLTLNLLPGSGCGRHLEAWHARDKAMPVAVLIGAPPALIFAAAANLPAACREDYFAAWLLGHKLKMAKSDNGLPFLLPAEAEMILEGEIRPDQRQNEGPFGCFRGVYGGMNDCPLIDLKSQRVAVNPIVPLTLAGPMPMEDCWLAQARLELDRARMRIDLPEISEVWQPLEAAFSGLYFVRCTGRVCAADLAERLRELGLLKPLRALVVCDVVPCANWQDRLKDQATGDSWRAEGCDFTHLDRRYQPRLEMPADVLTGLISRLSSKELEQLKL